MLYYALLSLSENHDHYHYNLVIITVNPVMLFFVSHVSSFELRDALYPNKKDWHISLCLVDATVDGRNPAPPGMYKTL